MIRKRLKRAKKTPTPSHDIMHNLNSIKQKLSQLNIAKLAGYHYVNDDLQRVQTGKVSEQELKELESAIDKFTENAAHSRIIPIPVQLEVLVKNLANDDDEQLAFSANKLTALLNSYHHQLEEYAHRETWFTPDQNYQSVINHPQKFSPKTGGAKNTGKRTGVYTFTEGERTERILIKQGADVGETIAEYMGASLYAMTIPLHSARCILVRDEKTQPNTIDDVYVGSVYQQANKIQDAYQAAGYSSRGMFAGVKARLKNWVNSDDSLIRKILNLNDETGHSLEAIAANVLWHGDHDFHTGNAIFVENNDNKKFVKIDHGFSFFNFDKKTIDIFNPFAGKVVNFSPKRFVKGGKLIEFYPTNHFWDYAVENKSFYFNAHFIKACEDIANYDAKAIRDNIEQSLNKVEAAYGPHAFEALKQFALRIGMKETELKDSITKKNPELLRFKIEDHMTYQLVQRQASIAKLADQCKKQTAKLNKKNYQYSKQLNKIIIRRLDHISKYSDSLTMAEKKAMLKEIELLKLVQQANDLGILMPSNNGELSISHDFYFHNNGVRQLVKPNDFKEEVNKIVGIRASKNKDEYRAFNQENKIPVREDALTILHKMPRTAIDSPLQRKSSRP
ncbi:hypothetical protein [Candidatus Berkiella aquae]|uniref:LepB N-terminal domain-containing protein n=1 Tax=Candidatus Berkiella aquae TaxID=295108 RepID=A0A0Q9YT63_9GAMM|nr:hypothetical protein [Candidatus Berkiella aquae]MCS5710838.1 hypothetical protein [Candidatus Berkiella aquae]